MPSVYHQTETKSTYVVRRSVTSGGFSFGGSGPSTFSFGGDAVTGCASFKFLFQDFASLPSEIGAHTESPEFTYKGNKWCISICPGGDSPERAGCLSLYLKHCDCGEAPSFGASFMNMAFQVSILDKHQNVKFKKVMTHGSRGWHNICVRSIVLDFLDDVGTLAIVVSSPQETFPFVPNNPMSDMIRGMFLDEDTADVRFQVSSASEDSNEDGDEAESSTFHAHRSILQGCAPMLALLFGTNDEKVEVVSITDVEPAIFHHMLHYVYGGDVAEEELNARAKDFINAADKYDIVNLKLAAEAAYVKSTKITMDNVIGILLYADRLNLALLKEVVVDFLVDNKAASQKLSFDDVPGYVMSDVFAALCRKMEGDEEGNDDLYTMSVSELRMKLAEHGLDVDGSREAMIEALKKVKPNVETAVNGGSPATAEAPAAPAAFGGVEPFRFVRPPAAAAPSVFGAPAPAFGERGG